MLGRYWRSLFTAALLLSTLGVMGGTASAATPSCSAANQASVSVGKSQPTTFTIGHARQKITEQLAFNYSGCTFGPGQQPVVRFLAPGGGGGRHLAGSADWEDEGDGIAFVELHLDGNFLPDGSTVANLVINGPAVSTLVVPLTLVHQYASLWLVAIAAAVAWAVAIYIGSAHAVAGGTGNPSIGTVWDVLRTHWFSCLLTVGAAYGAFDAAYESTSDFKGGYVALISLGAKVGAATVGALAITITAGNSASRATTALRVRSTAASPLEEK